LAPEKSFILVRNFRTRNPASLKVCASRLGLRLTHRLIRVGAAGLAGSALLAASVHALPVYREAWVVRDGVFRANLGPTIAELPDRTLIACWPAGSTEQARDVQIYCSRSAPGGPTWGSPAVVVRRGERPAGWILKNRTLANPVLYVDRERRLWLFYSAVDLPIVGWSGSHVDYKVSDDLGRSWAGGRRLVRAYGTLTKNKALELAPSEILLPVYHELFGTHAYVLRLSLHHGRIDAVRSLRIPGGDHIQPSLVPAGGDRVFAYLRTATSRVPRVLFSEYDPVRGLWSPATPLDVPNPKAPVDVLRAEDGKILMAYNATTRYRTPLSLAYSDDGRRFTKIWDFENQPGKRFSYPTLIRSSDGFYHVVYRYEGLAIKHVMFNREWLDARIRAGAR